MSKRYVDKVKANVLGMEGKREGRGFSLTELKQTGLNLQDVRNLKVAVDKKRRSALEENIKVLTYLKKSMGE